MPCADPTHEHPWPQPDGDELEEFCIEDCERKCSYCKGASTNKEGLYANATKLRQHVQQQHINREEKYKHIKLNDRRDSASKHSTVLQDLLDAGSPGHPTTRLNSTGELIGVDEAALVMDSTHRALHLHENDREDFRRLVHAHLKRTTDLDTLITDRKASKRNILTDTVDSFLQARAHRFWPRLNKSINDRGHLSQKDGLIEWGGTGGGQRFGVTGPIGAIDLTMLGHRRTHWKSHNPNRDLTDEVMRVESDLGLWILGYFMSLLDFLAGGGTVDGRADGMDEQGLVDKILQKKGEEG